MHRRLLTLLLILWTTAGAEEIRVAVAANFVTTAKTLAEAFANHSGHQVRLSSAATGIHYAQISHGAPFDLFLAADRRRPELLAKAGRGRMPAVYARGRLVFWAPGVKGDDDACRKLLRPGARIALADPHLAPYGRAAREVLETLGLGEQDLELVQGQNVAQTFAFVASGAVSGGFVAASQLTGRRVTGCRWPVPQGFHQPIEQVVVLLADRPAVKAFYRYLLGPEGRRIIAAAGYDLP